MDRQNKVVVTITSILPERNLGKFEIENVEVKNNVYKMTKVSTGSE
jgi:hypothetical protein